MKQINKILMHFHIETNYNKLGHIARHCRDKRKVNANIIYKVKGWFCSCCDSWEMEHLKALPLDELLIRGLATHDTA